MMEREVFVYVETPTGPMLTGRLWARIRKGRESASFEYDKTWLENLERFSLDPALTLGRGAFHTEKALFGAIGDSAPDRWGRVLMRRAERRRAEREGSDPRTLGEFDFLLAVNDEARQGALRFALDHDGPFLATHEEDAIPPLIALPKLLSATDHLIGNSETDEDLRLLLAPGSSLGGARPKASVRGRDGQLKIAKFPSAHDEIDVVRWEALALTLASRAGLQVSDWQVEDAGGASVLLLDRFDRTDGSRVPFLSAMSMLGANDHDTRSYLEVVDSIRQYGAAPVEDMRNLWRRVVFSILISNTDDHLRNHGFLYARPTGWRLSPAYDLNPVPIDIKPRVLMTAINEDDGTASLELALSVAEYFELPIDDAREIAAQVGKAVANWRNDATALGLTRRELDRMASAFEHEDLQAALA